MPDTNTAGGEAAGENKSQAGAGEGNTEQKPASTDTGGEDAGKGEGESGKGAKDTSKGNEPAKAPKDTQTGDDDQEPEVRPRMSAKDFIIKRKEAKIAKLQKKEGGEGGGQSGEDEGEDDEIAPEDEELITKVVSKRFAPILDKTLAAEDDKEIAAFLKDNPDFAPFEAKARKYIAHPSRRHLPVKTVFYEVAGDNLIKIGADRQRKADEDDKQTQTGGGSNRAGEGGKSVWDLTPEEFEAEKERVRRGQ